MELLDHMVVLFSVFYPKSCVTLVTRLTLSGSQFINKMRLTISAAAAAAATAVSLQSTAVSDSA